MRILLTGASSFTGCHFVRALAAAGHEVVATMTRPDAGGYADEPVRAERVAAVRRAAAETRFGLRFGDDAFVDLVRSGRFDLLCHHAADVTNYKSPDFDAVGAVANNVRGLGSVLEAFRAAEGRAVVLTGSVFEGGEGAGSEGLPHFSPYGLSKALTAEVFRYECGRRGLPLGKFVIPNPFGPLEEPRFTAYLVKAWLAGQTPGVKTPAYVRDNIHVSALAGAYARFAEETAARAGTPGFCRTSPSGYVESQGAFALRFAREMEPRLGVPCPVDLAEQTEFAEPRIRIGTDAAAMTRDEERRAWDEIAEFYLRAHRPAAAAGGRG